HDQEGTGFILVRVKSHDDIGMAETGDCLHFALKTADEGLVLFGQAPGQDLQGDDPLHPNVASLEDGTHAAGPEPVKYLVVADTQFREVAAGYCVDLEGCKNPISDEPLRQRWPVHPRVQGRVGSAVDLLNRKEHALLQTCEELLDLKDIGQR